MLKTFRNKPQTGETWGIYTPRGLELFFIDEVEGDLISIHAVKSPHKVWIGKIKDARGLHKVAGTLLEQEYAKQQLSGQSKTLEEFINVR